MRRVVVVALLSLLAPAALSAPPSPAQVVKYRVTLMKAAGGHMSALAMIAKGETDRTQDAAMHATALKDIATTFAALFPAGTGPAEGLHTEAKPEIWTQADKFAAALKTFETESAKLVETAKGGDVSAIKAQFGAVGASCGDCHDAFRVEDDH